MEAAGVEPASESTSSWDSTCVSASEFSCPAWGRGQNRRTPASENLAATRRGAAWPPACLMAFDPQPPGEVEANVTA